MTREERSVSLAILTLIVYSVFMYLEKGSILFPYPLNEVIFLIISTQFFWWNRHIPGKIFLYPAVSALVNLLSTQFFWSLWLDGIQMELLTTGPLLDILKLIYFVLLGIWAINTVRMFPNSTMLHGILAALLFLIPTIFPIPWVELVPLSAIVLYTTRYKSQNSNHLLWILLCTLQIMKAVMIYLT